MAVIQNSQEIERKWLVKKMPDLTNITPVRYERYFVFHSNKVEIRIQKVNDSFEFERKFQSSRLSRTKEKIKITETEFVFFKRISARVIIRDSFEIDKNVSIKVYHGIYKGLIRVEVEFDSEEEAQKYQSPSWFGQEITNTPLGKDSTLVDLSQKETIKLIEEISGTFNLRG
jgi:adenylate cyclase